LLTRFRETSFIFETHVNTISEDKIVECTQILKDRRVNVEIGLESAEPWVLQYCVNKSLEIQQVKTVLEILNKHRVGVFANIMVGIPFLSPSEMVAGAVSSVNWAFERGVDRCVIFPVNTKPWTLVYWMEERGIYKRPPLWALVEVLSRLEPQLLSTVELAWYVTRLQIHPKYTIPNQGPMTCPQCYDTVIRLLDQFSVSDRRSEIVEQLVNLQCSCKDAWNAQLELEPTLPLHERVKAAYQMMGKQILGPHWWSQKGESVLASIPVP
jgi:radical SAM enzyme (TIGR01210 family)